MAISITGLQFAYAEPAMRRLSEREMREQVIGREVTDDAHWADRYLPTGGDEGHSLGKAYVGFWRIENDELCTTRQAKRPQDECFEIWVSGSRVEYRRGDVTFASGLLRSRDHAASQP